VSLCPSSFGWEKGTTDEMVATVLSSLPDPVGSVLKEKSAFFHKGLAVDRATLDRYAGFSGFDTTGHAADRLGVQITLLQYLFPSEHSAYMAYRLGILTRLVMELESPFATAKTPRMRALGKQFMKDVEAHRTDLKYVPRTPRLIGSPSSYVRSTLVKSDSWAGPVRAQYLQGRGYNFLVQQAALKFYNSAIHSVIDVLYTVGSGKGGKVDDASLYGFYVDACIFYLNNGMSKEALADYRKLGKISSLLEANKIDSLEDAVDRYELVLSVFSLENRLRKSGIEIRNPLGNRMMAVFIAAEERLAGKYLDMGEKEKARVALSISLRERHLTGQVLQDLRKLYGLDKLENIEVPENAWKLYREANRFEAMAGKAFSKRQYWVANDYFVRAAAMYSTVPNQLRDMKRASLIRVNQIIDKMREIPPAALLSEELFQAAVDSMDKGDVDSAVRRLQKSRRWDPSEREIGETVTDAESLRLFMKGRELYQKENYEAGVRYFRRIKERFPRSPFAGPAKKMINFYERRKELEVSRLILLLKGAYEASFVGNRDGVYELCDEILESSPERSIRDRAQLLIAVAWYELRQGGYSRIDRVFKYLLRRSVLKEDDGKLVLRKRIDFYFGLRDPFPEMELSEFDEELLEKLGFEQAAVGPPDAAGEADEAIERARDEIEEAEELISRGETEDYDMEGPRTLLDSANRLLEEATDRFNEDAYEEAVMHAEDALQTAVTARESAEEILGVRTDLRDSTRDTLDAAESTVLQAESDLADIQILEEYDELEADVGEAKDMLGNAESLYADMQYQEAGELALEAVLKAEDVSERVEELRELASQIEEQEE
jgi:HEPN domain-containing protein